MFFKIYIQFSFIVLAYIKYEKTRTEHARIQISTVDVLSY